jgi:hypothetical protein
MVNHTFNENQIGWFKRERVEPDRKRRKGVRRVAGKVA